jgi:pimeloyl-ACP methyl ester carboxylesterase
MTRAAAEAVTDVGSGPPILLVHGQPGSRADWRGLIPLLASDHRVIAIDRPGYGSNRAPSLGLEQNAFQLGLLLAEREAVGATVVGHSLGAGIALAMAERALGAGGLVLVGAAGVEGTVGALDHVLALPLVGSLGVSAVRVVTRTFWRDRERPVVAAIDGWGPQAGRSFAREQRALLREHTVLESALGQIDVPTTVVVGGRDRVVGPAAQRALSGRIPGATIIELADAGHLIPITRAPELAAIVRAASTRVQER